MKLFLKKLVFLVTFASLVTPSVFATPSTSDIAVANSTARWQELRSVAYRTAMSSGLEHDAAEDVAQRVITAALHPDKRDFYENAAVDDVKRVVAHNAKLAVYSQYRDESCAARHLIQLGNAMSTSSPTGLSAFEAGDALASAQRELKIDSVAFRIYANDTMTLRQKSLATGLKQHTTFRATHDAADLLRQISAAEASKLGQITDAIASNGRLIRRGIAVLAGCAFCLRKK